MSNLYRFPRCTKAECAPCSTQVVKVLEEVYELVEVQNNDPFDDLRILEETWDVIHAAEGVLRKYQVELVEHMRESVEQKNRERGYYDK